MIRVSCIKDSDNLDLDLGKSDGSITRVRRAKRYLFLLEWGVDERSCAWESWEWGSVLNLYNILYIIYIIILSIITSLFLVFFVALVIPSELFFRNKFPNISFSSPWFKLFQKYSKKVLTYTVKVIYLNHTGGRKYETINNYDYRKRLDFK